MHSYAKGEEHNLSASFQGHLPRSSSEEVESASLAPETGQRQVFGFSRGGVCCGGQKSTP